MRKKSAGIKRLRSKMLGMALIFGVLVTGCGSASGQYKEAASEEIAMDTAAASAGGYDSGNGFLGDGAYYEMEEAIAEEGYEPETVPAGEAPRVQETNRKLIRNVNLEVETETFDELLISVQRKTESAGGYIEESYTYNGSNYYGKSRRNANMTIRVPADKLEEFLTNIAEVSNVVSRNESVTDVTLQYVDMESHKKVLLAEQERLLELLEQAENIEDIISLESRLSEVRYQIESMESQLRTMDNQVSYSTVYLYIDEVAKLTPVQEQSVWEKITTGFAASLYDVGNGLADFGIGLIIDLPYIILWIVIILVILLIVRLIIKLLKKRREKALSSGAQAPASGKKTGWGRKKNRHQENKEQTTDDESAGKQ